MTYQSTLEKYIVLDKNAMRKAVAATAKADADKRNLGVLFIDTAFVEIANHGAWVDQVEKDLRDWTDKPARFGYSVGSGELLREEFARGARALTVVDVGMTAAMQRILSELASGDKSTLAAAEPRFRAEAAKLKLPGGRLDPAVYLGMLQSMLAVWEAWEDPALRKRLADELKGAGPLAELGTLVLSPRMDGLLQSGFALAGASPAAAAALAGIPSFAGLLHRTYFAYTLALWAQGMRAANLTNGTAQLNQMMDLDYVAYGLCCEGYVSAEVLMSRLESGLRTACMNRWPA